MIIINNTSDRVVNDVFRRHSCAFFLAWDQRHLLFDPTANIYGPTTVCSDSANSLLIFLVGQSLSDQIIRYIAHSTVHCSTWP